VTLDFQSFWAEAIPWPAYFAPDMEQYSLWKGVYDHVVIPGWALEQFMRGPVRRLLVLAEDWCGDAANTVPVLARLADLVPSLELRILERDRYPQVMNRYLTDGTRSIPMVIALNQEFDELGHWGPRPLVLQEWVLANQKMMPTPQRYAYARGWYARDKGESTLRELLARVNS
jgi:hypothetical protein